jgi:hypothetical protein
VAPTPTGTGEIDVGASAAPPDTNVVDMISVDGTDSTLDGTNLWLGGSAAGVGGLGVLSITNGGTVNVTQLTVYPGSVVNMTQGYLVTDPLTIDGVGDISGSGEIDGNITDNGTITGDSSGLLNLNANEISGTGTLQVGPFGNMLIDGIVDPTLSILFDPGHQTETLSFVFPWEIHAPISNFFDGDTINLGRLANISYDYVGNTLEIDSTNPDTNILNPQIDLVFVGTYTKADFTLTSDSSDYTALTTDVPCFAAGTRIRTLNGDIAVEDLREGDIVVTRTAGRAGARPIVWIGRTEIDLAETDSAHPIRIRAGAFGVNLPERDLLVSPEHAIHANGVLIPARSLINGATITQDTSKPAITYFHIECAEHEILLAEGLEAESYLDTGNRYLLERAA